MFASLLRAAVALPVMLAVGACGGGRSTHQHAASSSLSASGWTPDVRDGYDRVRAATERFHVLDSAVAAGYARDVPRCFQDPARGAMGFHHVNRALVDAQLDIERPEILVYERHPDGRYTFNGVEYIVPYSRWPRDSVPPRLMGVTLAPADDLNIWYLHMWVWKNNPQGLFAPWNPDVRCPS